MREVWVVIRREEMYFQRVKPGGTTRTCQKEHISLFSVAKSVATMCTTEHDPGDLSHLYSIIMVRHDETSPSSLI